MSVTLSLKLFAVISFAASASASCIHEAHGHSFSRRAADDAVPISNFGYSGEKGPINWASIDPANSACRTGKVQSPIDLDSTVSKAKTQPVIKLQNVGNDGAVFQNIGTHVEAVVNGTVSFGGKDFSVLQYHLHTPSEHRINDEYFPLEMHLAQIASDNSILVIAIPFQLTEDGSTTSVLTSTVANIEKIAQPGTRTTTAAIDFGAFSSALQSASYFQYTGSLTTPPCSEGLEFLVAEQPLPIDVKTYNRIKKVVKFNARITQNQLGKDNLLTIAEELGNGVNVTQSGEGDAVNLDGNGLAKLLAAARNSSDIQVVTTTTTQTRIVMNGDGSDAPQQGKATQSNANSGVQSADAGQGAMKAGVVMNQPHKRMTRVVRRG